MGNNLFLKNYITSDGVFFHNVLYYQQLPIPFYHVSFYAKSILSNYQKCSAFNDCVRHIYDIKWDFVGETKRDKLVCRLSTNLFLHVLSNQWK